MSKRSSLYSNSRIHLYNAKCLQTQLMGAAASLPETVNYCSCNYYCARGEETDIMHSRPVVTLKSSHPDGAIGTTSLLEVVPLETAHSQVVDHGVMEAHLLERHTAVDFSLKCNFSVL